MKALNKIHIDILKQFRYICRLPQKINFYVNKKYIFKKWIKKKKRKHSHISNEVIFYVKINIGHN